MKKNVIILILIAFVGGLACYIIMDVFRDMSNTGPVSPEAFDSIPSNVDEDIAVPVEAIPEGVVEEDVEISEEDTHSQGIKGIEWEYNGKNDEAFELPKQTMLIETARKIKGDTSNKGKLLCSGDYTYYAKKRNGQFESVNPSLYSFTVYERWLFDRNEIPFDFVGMVTFENDRCRRYNGISGSYLLVKPNGDITRYSYSEDIDIMNHLEKNEYYEFYEWGDTRDQYGLASSPQPSSVGSMGAVGINPNTNQSQNIQTRQRCITCGGTGNCSNPSSAYNSRTYCHGSGLCPLCGGDGFTENPYSTQKQRCSSCNGNGRCQHCLGTGQCPRCGGSGYM